MFNLRINIIFVRMKAIEKKRFLKKVAYFLRMNLGRRMINYKNNIKLKYE